MNSAGYTLDQTTVMFIYHC